MTETKLKQQALQLLNFTAPTLLNSWVNYGSGFNDAGYGKGSDGVVRLKGLVRNGGNNAIFILPVGYRPTSVHIFIVQTESAFGTIYIYTDGAVTKTNGSSNWLSLDGISFFVGN